MATAAQEAAKAEKRRESGFMPFRFYMKPDPVKKKEIIILDRDPSELIGFYEHNIKDSSGKWQNELCPAEFEVCPLCQDKNVGNAQYIIMATCLLLEDYVDKNGVKHTYSKMLLPMKGVAAQAFIDYHTLKGGWRGQHIMMARYTDKEINTGRPFELVEKYTEEDLIESFGHPAKFNEKGECYKQENEDIYPFDYRKLFNKKPSAADLRRRYGYAPTNGSSEEYKNSFGGNSANTPQEGGRGMRGLRNRTSDTQEPAVAGSNDLDDEVPF